MKKLPRIEKWFAVQLTNLVICGQVFGKKNVPQGFNFYTGLILGIKDNYVICKEGRNPVTGEDIIVIYELGVADKVWIQTGGAKVLDVHKI